ncbi:MAG: hypothetical protein ACI4X9_01990 [Kiritimatiellia bacterium]
MFTSIGNQVWAFDCEWIPDARAGRILHKLPPAAPDEEVLKAMWLAGGATEENPTPFLKYILCRVVSIAVLIRKQTENGTTLKLFYLPDDPDNPAAREEKQIVGRFLSGVGKQKPQLVGYNSRGSDWRILLQRAVTLGVSAKELCQRPLKPWDGYDYFSHASEAHIDLQECLAPSGFRNTPSLNELCSLSGIPGKFETHGEEVFTLWQNGQYRSIVEYNCFDAISTYLLWLRTAHFAGLFDDNQYDDEQALLRDYLMELCEDPKTAFVERYLDEWGNLE